jgi:hypothetical protein
LFSGQNFDFEFEIAVNAVKRERERGEERGSVRRVEQVKQTYVSAA